MLPSPPHTHARGGGGHGGRSVLGVGGEAGVVRQKEATRDDSNELTRCNTCVESSSSNRRKRDRRDWGGGELSSS